MCYYVRVSSNLDEIEMHYESKFSGEKNFKTNEIVNGFGHPSLPIALLEELKIFNWGLIPSWAKDNSIQKKTLNARIETIRERNAYKQYVDNRCLLPINGFYEWKHLDGGKTKLKHRIKLKDQNLFSLGCIYAKDTFSIVTTAANEVMEEIHKTKKRMPVIIPKELERDWLTNPDIEGFAKLDVVLEAEIVD